MLVYYEFKVFNKKIKQNRNQRNILNNRKKQQQGSLSLQLISAHHCLLSITLFDY